MQDEAKIKAKKDELNKRGDGKWDDVVGYLTMPNINYVEATKSFAISLGSGLSIKAFINLDTHEIKLYPLPDFLKDNDGKKN